MPKYTADEIVQRAKEISKEVNPLSLRDFTRLSGITADQIGHAFPEGRWSTVQELVGLERHPMDRDSLTDDQLLREFHRVTSDLGRIPTWIVFESRANVSDSVVSNRFGGRSGTLKRYSAWLKEYDPTSPLLEKVEVELKRTPSKHPSKSKPNSNKSVTRRDIRFQIRDKYIDESRLNELRAIKSSDFDLVKLIRLCEELNDCYASKSYFAVAMLVRTILNHVPPIFGFNEFAQVANNYSTGARSFRESIQHLENSSRKIADAHLHTQIRKRESLPNQIQVNFRNDLDVLLAEIVRVLR